MEDTPAPTENDGYRVSYKNNIDVGTGSLIITGYGNYTGTIVKNFTISAPESSGGGSTIYVPEGHTHEWDTEYTIDNVPTCTIDGSKSIHCKTCEAIKNSTVIEAEGHKYGEWKVTKEATCSSAGSRERVCSVCNRKETEAISVKEHSFGEWTITKEATCTSPGKRESVCSECNKTVTEVIPMLGHKLTKIKGVKAGCETEGQAECWKCKVCNKIFNNMYMSAEVDEADLVLEPTGHSWNNGVITKKATGTKAGVITYTCTVCGEKKTEAYTIKAQPMTVNVSPKTVKASKLKKKAQNVKAIYVSSAQGKVTYKIVGGNPKSKKALKLNTKNGKIKVKKGTRKGTYTIKVKVTAAGNTKYTAGSKTVDVSVQVK